MRGAGKSTLARTVSDNLDLPLIELTLEIEQASGLNLREIYSLYDEGGYRELESRCLRDVTERHTQVVLAVAGGITNNADSYEFLLDNYHTVWLQASPMEHMQRVLDQGDRRPVSGISGAMDALVGILEKRKDQYARARFHLDTSEKTVQESTAAPTRIVGPLIDKPGNES